MKSRKKAAIIPFTPWSYLTRLSIEDRRSTVLEASLNSNPTVRRYLLYTIHFFGWRHFLKFPLTTIDYSAKVIFNSALLLYLACVVRLSSLVVRVPCNISRGSGFHPRHYPFSRDIFVLERGPLSPLRIIKDLIENCVLWDVTPYGCCKNRRFGRT
jgi:hypothetical protein